MNGSSTSSPDRYDAIRAANPELVVNLYGMTPLGPVTLEIIAPDGSAFSWTALTAADAMAQAFPVAEATESSPAPAAPPSIFD